MKPRDVIEIFEDFEEDADDEDLTDWEKMKEVLKYVADRKTRNLWKSFDGYDEEDYMMFKGSVFEYYLGTKKTTRYFFEQLEELLDEIRSRHVTIRRLTDFYAQFSPIVLWLEDKEIISTSETNEFFWDGLPKSIRKLIAQRMDLGTTIPSMKRAFKKARRVTEAMLEEEEELDGDFGEWPSIMETTSTVEFLTNREPSDDNEGVEQELQEFEGSEGDVVLIGELEGKDGAVEAAIKLEPQDLENDDDDAQGNLECPDEAMEHMENLEPEELRGLDDKGEEVLVTYEAAVEKLPAPIENVPDEGVLPSKQVALDALSMPWDLPNFQNDCVLSKTRFCGPTHRIFAYTKVRKKVYHSGIAMRRRTEDFHHFFGHSQSVSLHVLLDRSLDISCPFRMPGGNLELVMSFCSGTDIRRHLRVFMGQQTRFSPIRRSGRKVVIGKR